MTHDPWCGAKWVRIMCDFYADAVWNIEGASCDVEALPISRDLALALRSWQDIYDRCAPDGMVEKTVWDGEAFSRVGLFLARRVKAELPSWTILYFDEHRLSQGGEDVPRSYFEYEIEA
jgi:hypothetical protein